MTIRKLLLGAVAATLLAISPAALITGGPALAYTQRVPCGPGISVSAGGEISGGHPCLHAKVGSWELREVTLFLEGDGEGSNFLADSGDVTENLGLVFYQYVIRTPSKPVTPGDRDRFRFSTQDADTILRSDKLTLEFSEGGYSELLKDRATIEVFIFPDKDVAAGIKVLAHHQGTLGFQPTSDQLAVLMQARESISIKISDLPLLTYPARGTAEAVNALLEVIKKARDLR
jgi:hypothetical protein